MPTNHTQNYGLSQWEPGDAVLRADFNADNAKIDGALAALAGQMAGKADQPALDALSQTVSGHASALNGKGNCRICTVTYTGRGGAGASAAVSVSFPGTPLLVFVSEPSNGIFSVMFRGSSYAVNSASASSFNVTWSGNSVSWYHRDGGHFNTNGTTYTVVALVSLG